MFRNDVINMARSTVYNNITSPEKIEMINSDNIDLVNDYLEYLSSIDRAKSTLEQYKHDLMIFFCWNLEFNKNKLFTDLTKRELIKFQNHALSKWEWSPKRTRRVKSTLSSLSNYIENILDDEYENYRPIVRKIENPPDTTVREKSIFTDEQLQWLLDTLVENKQYMRAAMLSLAMASGRRKAELPRFKVTYFDDANVLYGSLWKTPEKVVTKGHGSKGKLLNLFVFKNQFEPYLNLWMKEREKLGITSIWLFPKRNGNTWLNEPITIKTMDRWADDFSELLEMDFYWHSLRHYFTTYCSRSGLPDNVIQQLVGWSSSDMVTLYNDISTEETLAKYFDESGIKQVEQTNLSDM